MIKQQFQPYHWLVVLAGLFLATGLSLFVYRTISANFIRDIPVEPLVKKAESGLADFWFAGADFLDLSADRNMTGILLGATNNKVSLLDRGKRLRWEKNFPSEPLQAKLSACGNFLAVGTAGGRLFYMSTDQQLWWEVEGDAPVYKISISANGKWVAAGRGNPGDQQQHQLELYNQQGIRQWSVTTSAPVQKLFLVGEHIEQGRIFYSWSKGELATTTALTLEGDTLWEHEGESLAAISRSGSRLAVSRGDQLLVYDFLGRLLWDQKITLPLETALFNPFSQNILLYGQREGNEPNLFYFSAEGELLWQKRVADGSLFAFTADGRYLVTSSWRHYKDDFSQMTLINEEGLEVQRWDVAMRVERLLITGNRRYIVLGGEDGYIEIIDLDEQLKQDTTREVYAGPIYAPYTKVTNLVTLFFTDGEHLIPVSRTVRQTDNQIRAAIEELIRGPARGSFLFRLFSKEDRIEVRFVDDTGRLYLDMPLEVARFGGSAKSIATLDSLRFTLSGFPEIREIYIMAEGEKIDSFGDGLHLEQPLMQHRWREPVFVPVRSGERYYLVPREAGDLEIEQRDLTGLLKAVLQTSRTFYFAPSDLQLLEVREDEGSVTINLNSALLLLFPEAGGEEERLHAALVLDALFLTAFENSGAERIEILVEGQSWTPPEGYPDFRRTFYEPYFLNPE